MSETYFDMDPNSHKRYRAQMDELDGYHKVLFPHQINIGVNGPSSWFNTPHPAYATTDKMIEPPDGELLTSDTAHGVPIERLRRVNE